MKTLYQEALDAPEDSEPFHTEVIVDTALFDDVEYGNAWLKTKLRQTLADDYGRELVGNVQIVRDAFPQGETVLVHCEGFVLPLAQ